MGKWRVGHHGRDGVYYEERHFGVWRRIEIEGEMLTGRAHHVLYFRSPARWREYPDWARERRDEIIARVKSALRPPEYEYDEPTATAAAAQAAPSRPSAPPPSPARRGAPPVPASQRRALLLAIVLLLGIAGGTAWMAHRGVTTGTARWPVARGTHGRMIARDAEPAMFWFAVGVYGTVALATGVLAALGVRELHRLGR